MKLIILAACLVAGISGSSLRKGVTADEPTCPPTGDHYLPHPDCTLYYRCSNGFLFEQACPGNTYWNTEIDQCDFIANVPECVGGTRPPTGTEPTVPPTEAPVTTEEPAVTTAGPVVTTEAPATETEAPATKTDAPATTEAPEVTTRDPSNPCTEDGIYALPVENDCAAYTQCVEGQAFSMTCASGLLFDAELGKCNKEELVDCSVTTTEASVTTPEAVITTEAPICEAEGVYNLPYAGNCSLYILCANGVPVLQACAPELLFDPIELTCVRAEDSTCTVEVPTTTAAPETTEAQVPTTSQPQPIRCEEDGLYAIPIPDSDCTDYILCVNTIPYLQSCANGTLFSHITLQCVRDEDYTCPSSEEPTTAAPELTTEAEEPTNGPTTEAPVEPTTGAPVETTPVDLYPCPATDLHYLPHPSLCRSFYMCVDGEFRGVFSCGSGHWFHSVLQACVKPEESDCTLEPLP